MSDFFSGSKPDLISLKCINDLAILGGKSPENLVTFQVKKQWDPKTIYYSYIKPNMVPIVLILLFLLALLIRYFMLKDNLEINKKESFNSAESVFVQPNHNNYVTPSSIVYDVEDNIDENELFEKIKKKTEIPFEKYVNDDKKRNLPIEQPDDDDKEIIYKGRDDWLNQFNSFDNPFYGNNLVTSTADAVKFGLEQNQKSIDLDKLAKDMFG